MYIDVLDHRSNYAHGFDMYTLSTGLEGMILISSPKNYNRGSMTRYARGRSPRAFRVITEVEIRGISISMLLPRTRSQGKGEVGAMALYGGRRLRSYAASEEAGHAGTTVMLRSVMLKSPAF